jgi:hypothetical protein
LAELLRGFPQPWKLRRSGTAAGVSPASSAILMVAAAAWLVYAVWVAAWPAVLSGVVAATLTSWCALLVARLTNRTREMLRVGGVAAGCAASLAAVAAVLGAGPAGLAVVLVAGTAAYGVPRLVVGLSSPSLAGLSPLALGLNVADAAVFAVFGVMFAAPGYVGYAVVQIACSLPVLLRWALLPSLRR